MIKRLLMIPILFLRYLFPKKTRQQKVPLVSLYYTSKDGRHGKPSEKLAHTVTVLKAHGIARTDHDAQRILAKHPGLEVGQIVKLEKRKRRRMGTLQKAHRRLKRIW